MASPIEICNGALTLIGAKTIESLEENSQGARACALFWPILRDAVLRDHPWNCATTRVNFNRLVETPAYEFAYYFQLPSNCLHVHEVYPDQFFEVEGRKIAANGSALSGKVIFQQTDASKYDPQLSLAFMHLLGGQLAVPLTASNSRAQELTGLGDKLLSDAKASDALEGKRQDKRGNSWLRARRGGR